jgi:propanediol dehydratase large subunit
MKISKIKRIEMKTAYRKYRSERNGCNENRQWLAKTEENRQAAAAASIMAWRGEEENEDEENGARNGYQASMVSQR